MCKKYDIQSLDEAKEYLRNDYLRDNLINICKALLTHEGKKDIKDIMSIDDCKLLSCMTLFNKADEEENKCGGIFKKVMDVFYEGKEDELTINILENQRLEMISHKEKENEKDKKINIINEKKEINANVKKNDIMLINEKKEEKKEIGVGDNKDIKENKENKDNNDKNNKIVEEMSIEDKKMDIDEERSLSKDKKNNNINNVQQIQQMKVNKNSDSKNKNFIVINIINRSNINNIKIDNQKKIKK
jgi:hypothetical protein